MKMVVSYLNFVFFIEVKAKNKYRTLNFVFKFIKKKKWFVGYTDCLCRAQIFSIILRQHESIDMCKKNSSYFIICKELRNE